MSAPMAPLTSALLAAGLCLPALAGAQAVLPNGGFEAGDLSGGWSAGGNGGTVDVLTSGDLVPSITAPEGAFYAIVCTGPGNGGAPPTSIDGNGVSEFDLATLSIGFTLSTAAELSFVWDFVTDEEDEPWAFDDIFEVTLSGPVPAQLLTGSVNKPGGASPWPDAPDWDDVAYEVNRPGSPTHGSYFGEGRSGFTSVASTITTPGDYSLRFLVADQGDQVVDSALLVDDVRVRPHVDLAVTKDDGLTTVTPGQPITYTIVVPNAGPADAAGATVADAMPAELTGVSWTCAASGGATCTASGSGDINDVVSLPVASSVTYTVSATLASGATGSLVNTVTVTEPDDRYDTDPDNNSASDVDTITAGITPRQLTDSSGATVFVKNGGFVHVILDNREVAVSNNGSTVCFISGADYAGNNPDAGHEVFCWTPGGFEQITRVDQPVAFAHVQHPAVSRSGRWVVFVSWADLTGDNGDWNPEIFRHNRNSGQTIQVTRTASCASSQPSVSNNGRVISFLTTCADLVPSFNADGNLEPAVWNNGAFVVHETTSCTTSEATVARRNAGDWVALVSTCDLVPGANLDGNSEVFRWAWPSGGAGFEQITTTVDAISYSVSTSRRGDAVVFVSDGDLTGGNTDGSSEVFRFTAGGGGLIEQLTSSSLSIVHLSARVDDSGRHVAFEQLDIPTSSFAIYYQDASSGAQAVVVHGMALMPAVGVRGGVPIVAFEGSGDWAGTNPDGNLEIFTALIE